MRKILICLFVGLLIYCKGYAQQPVVKSDSTANFVIQFRFNRSVVDSGYMQNNTILKHMDDILRDKNTLSIDSITIVASSSPEGVIEHNLELARRRALAVRGYLIWKYPHINRDIIKARHVGENWSGLRDLVETDLNVPYRERVLATIDADVNPATKEWRLKQIGNGESWVYIENNFLRLLRSGATCVIMYRQNDVEIKISKPEEPIEKEEIPKQVEIVEPIIEQPPVEIEKESVVIHKPLFAIKTNLLYDAISALNIEIEVPLGNRWSVSAEWLFPWWKSNSANWTMQMMSGHGAIKYWFGDRTKHDALTGWNLGVYGGGGKYDLQFFNKNGEQANFFDVGIQLGYAHKIGKALRLEYSVGIGYMQADYKEYDKVRDTKYGDIKVFRYPWETKRRDWIGPTSAKISLVWLLNYKSSK